MIDMSDLQGDDLVKALRAVPNGETLILPTGQIMVKEAGLLVSPETLTKAKYDRRTGTKGNYKYYYSKPGQGREGGAHPLQLGLMPCRAGLAGAEGNLPLQVRESAGRLEGRHHHWRLVLPGAAAPAGPATAHQGQRGQSQQAAPGHPLPVP